MCRTLAATARLISRGTAVASSVTGRSGGCSPGGRSEAPRAIGGVVALGELVGLPGAGEAAIGGIEAVHGLLSDRLAVGAQDARAGTAAAVRPRRGLGARLAAERGSGTLRPVLAL